jgi:NAD(P)-dependent dehydrogenase (short-subunit alcohol dehydrogenase family)
MKVAGKVVVVTGGANGIGQALAEIFHREGAAKVVVADLDGARAKAVADSIGGASFACDVGKEADILMSSMKPKSSSAHRPVLLECGDRRQD